MAVLNCSKIALTGASGFLGTRILEMWGLSGRVDFVSILRGYGSAAPVGRLDLPFRVADVCDAQALFPALEGCDNIVHVALGDPAQIVTMAEAVCMAAERAGIRRIVNLSSAVALGMVPPYGSGDATAGETYKPLDYCSAKGIAESIFARHMAKTGCSVIQLRPFTIYGPRSRLVGRILGAMAQGQTWLLNGGAGVCNAVYIDNVIHAIECALLTPKQVGGIFHINDTKAVSWLDFYTAMANAAGLPSGPWMEPPSKPTDPPPPSLPERVKVLTSKPLPQSVFRYVPERAKRIVKGMIAAWPEPHLPNPRMLPSAPQLLVDRELYDLQSGTWRFDCGRANEVLAYAAPVSFAEGVRRTVEWYRVFG
ncbi:MAG: NAD(P)-dependent oxidoreductase [Puniceicoccaceae bacterium]|nr:MAG: NAD(P)-dependent oxidoreductase [Puniceicoccaceae bacterium]